LSTTKSRSRANKHQIPAIRQADPFYAREIERYESPLPSREYILQLLTEAGCPVDTDAFADQLEITEAERDLFQRRLGAMQRDGQLMLNRKRQLCLPDKLDLIKGRVEGHPDGFGFVVPEEGGEISICRENAPRAARRQGAGAGGRLRPARTA
jgi:ribonuclease R